MGKNKLAENQRRLDETLGGVDIAALNGVSPGLGLKLQRMFSSLGSSVSAQAGHKGTIAVKKQTGKDSKGRVNPGLTLEGNRIADLGDAIDNQDAVTLKQIRRLLDPENIKEVLSAVNRQEIGTPGPPGAAGGNACTNFAFRDRRRVTTGLSDCHSVQVLNEFVYLFGLNGVTPTLELYRIQSDRDLVFVDSITLSQEMHRTVLHGDHIYGAVDGAGSSKLYIISIDKPDAMSEVGNLDVTDTINDLYAEGRFVWLATELDVKAVNVSNPAIPVLV